MMNLFLFDMSNIDISIVEISILLSYRYLFLLSIFRVNRRLRAYFGFL